MTRDDGSGGGGAHASAWGGLGDDMREQINQISTLKLEDIMAVLGSDGETGPNVGVGREGGDVGKKGGDVRKKVNDGWVGPRGYGLCVVFATSYVAV
jgi:hypothetical protein